MLVIDVDGLYPALEAQVSHPGPHDHVYPSPDTDEFRGYLVGALLAELIAAADPRRTAVRVLFAFNGIST